eukprot:Hpha_TRINITY_DN16332_c3_g6::TRINITY_DN16332_c3_g6_i1::g.60934::m.60934/K06671/STAG1_2, SCC3, IRR1; cohesin complex subunit SA-1/2
MPAKRKRSGSPRRTREEVNLADAGASLLEQLYQGGAFKMRIDDFVDLVKAGDPERVAGELVSCLVLSCGAEGEITMEHIMADTPEDVLQEVAARMPEEGEKYPLASTDKKNRKFQANWNEFWRTLAAREGAALLLDNDFRDKLMGWFNVCMEQKVRSLRHHATAAVLNMVHGVCTNLKDLRDADKEGRKGKRDAERERKMRNLTDVIESLLMHGARNRVRDVVPDIRVLALQMLGNWAEKWQGVFTPEYSKNIGWSLSDKEPSVRLAAVQATLQLYQADGPYEQLKKFLVRYGPRLLQMTLDYSPKVQCAAIETLTRIVQVEHEHDEDDPVILQERNTENLLSLIVDERLCVRVQVAGFLRQVLWLRLHAKYPGLATPQERNKRRLELFVVQMVRGPWKTHARAPELFVDALFHSCHHSFFEPAVMLAQVATAESPGRQLGLTDDDSAAVLAVVLQTLRAVVLVPKGKLDLNCGVKDDESIKRSKKEIDGRDKAWAKVREDLHNELVRAVPELLQKSLDESCTNSLLGIVRGLPAESWAKAGAGKHKGLHAVLDKLSHLFGTETKEVGLREVCSTWRHLAEASHAQADEARRSWRNSRKTLLKKLSADSPSPETWLRLRMSVQENLEWSDELRAATTVKNALESVDPGDAHMAQVGLSAMLFGWQLCVKAIREGDTTLIGGYFASVLPRICQLCAAPQLRDDLSVLYDLLNAATTTWTIMRHPGLAKIPGGSYNPTDREERGLMKGVDAFLEGAKVELATPPGRSLASQGQRLELEAHTSDVLLATIRMFACSLIHDNFLGSFYRHWPRLHQRGQQIVAELWKHKSVTDSRTAWQADCHSIQLAHRRYMESGDSTDSRDRQSLADLHSLVQKFVNVQAFEKERSREWATKVVESIIDYAAKLDSELDEHSDDTNTHVLAALQPTARFLDRASARQLAGKLQECSLRGVDIQNGVPNSNRTVLVSALAKAAGTQRETLWDTVRGGLLSTTLPGKPTVGAIGGHAPTPSPLRARALFEDEDDTSLMRVPARRERAPMAPPVSPARTIGTETSGGHKRSGGLSQDSELASKRPRTTYAATTTTPSSARQSGDIDLSDDDDIDTPVPRGKGKGRTRPIASTIASTTTRTAARTEVDDDDDDDDDDTVPRGKGKFSSSRSMTVSSMARTINDDEDSDEAPPRGRGKGKGVRRTVPTVTDDDDDDDMSDEETTRPRGKGMITRRAPATTLDDDDDDDDSMDEKPRGKGK